MFLLKNYFTGGKVSGIKLIEEVRTLNIEKIEFVLKECIKSHKKSFIIFQLNKICEHFHANSKINQIKFELCKECALKLECCTTDDNYAYSRLEKDINEFYEYTDRLFYLKDFSGLPFEIREFVNCNNNENLEDKFKFFASEKITLLYQECLEFYINCYDNYKLKCKDLDDILNINEYFQMDIMKTLNENWPFLFPIKNFMQKIIKRERICICNNFLIFKDEETNLRANFKGILEESCNFFVFKSNNFLIKDKNCTQKLSFLFKKIFKILGEKFETEMISELGNKLEICSVCSKADYENSTSSSEFILSKKISMEQNTEIRCSFKSAEPFQCLRILVLALKWHFFISKFIGEKKSNSKIVSSFSIKDILKNVKDVLRFIYYPPKTQRYSISFLNNILKISLKFFNLKDEINDFFEKLIEKNDEIKFLKHISIKTKLSKTERLKEIYFFEKNNFDQNLTENNFYCRYFREEISANNIYSEILAECIQQKEPIGDFFKKKLNLRNIPFILNPLYLNLELKLEADFNLEKFKYSDFYFFKNFLKKEILKEFILQKFFENFYKNNKAPLEEIFSPIQLLSLGYLQETIFEIYDSLFNNKRKFACFEDRKDLEMYYITKQEISESCAKNLFLETEKKIKKDLNNESVEIKISRKYSKVKFILKKCEIVANFDQFLKIADIFKNFNSKAKILIGNTRIYENGIKFLDFLEPLIGHMFILQGEMLYLKVDVKEGKFDLFGIKSILKEKKEKRKETISNLARILKREKKIELKNLVGPWEKIVNELILKDIAVKKDEYLFYVP